MDQFCVGDRVTWLCAPRGGYGYIWPVDAEVVKINRVRLRLRAKRWDGSYGEVNVRPENVRRKEASST